MLETSLYLKSKRTSSRPSYRPFIICLILALTLHSNAILAQSITLQDLIPPSCLSRAQKEKIEICFRENESCHDTLEKMTQPPPNETTWQAYTLIVLVSGITGAIIGAQVHH